MTEKGPVENQQISTIGIVGGGKVGLQFYNLFTRGGHVKVSYIVDMDKKAPAIEAAKADGVATFTDFKQAITQYPTDFLFEITGSNKVKDLLAQELKGKATQFITHDMAFILMRSIEDDNAKTKKLVSADIFNIKNDISRSFDMMAVTVGEIRKTMSDLRLLSLNARIEAARAGEAGRGFDIVAQSVEKTAEEVRIMTENIEKVNEDISKVMDRINNSLEKLK
jgi:hypothetical protein